MTAPSASCIPSQPWCRRQQMRGALALVTLLGLLLTGCRLGPVCNEPQPVNLPDGGPFPCQRAEDCMLPSNTEICVATGDRSDNETTCVTCQSFACVRYLKVECN